MIDKYFRVLQKKIIFYLFITSIALFGCNGNDPEPYQCSEVQIKIPGPVQVDGIYPQGKNFPLILYAVTESELPNIGQFGWNVSHIYRLLSANLAGTSLEYIEASKTNKLLTHTVVPYNWVPDRNIAEQTPVDSATFANFILQRHATNNVSWWDMPEEMRFWKETEFQMLKDYSRWTKLVDPGKRPVHMYIPGHYTKDNIRYYVDYIDIIPASCYVEYMEMPRSYVRNQIEKIFQAMKDKRRVEGKNYLNNEKTVVAILELYQNQKKIPITAEGIHHDFWSALASGAKGISVYSHAYRSYHPEAWAQLCKDASNLVSSERLDQVILNGELDTEITFTITEGEQNAPIVENVTYPSLNVRAWNIKGIDGNCYKYIIAVNSSSNPITAKISGIRGFNQKVEVLFEERETMDVKNGEFTDVFIGNGVHIYKVK